MKSELERAKSQFEYEKKHHDRILAAPKGEARAKAFSEAYGGLAEGMRDGRFLDQETEPQAKATQKFQLLKRFLNSESNVAECGPGSFHLAQVVAPKVKSLALVDVTNNNPDAKLPSNCTFYQNDGVHLPSELNNLDLVWSAHVVEHIHPDELADHLFDVRRALADKGHYIIFTPNRFSGPHDISKKFADEAQGLHLREYTAHELEDLLVQAGYTKRLWYAGGKGLYLRIPFGLVQLVEFKLWALPKAISKRLVRLIHIRAILGIIVAAQK